MRFCIIIGALLSLGACNTIQGFGEDLQEGGAALEEAAESAQYEQEPAPVYRAPQQQPPAPIYRAPQQPPAPRAPSPYYY